MGALTEVLSSVLLFFLVFGMSATVDVEKLRKQLKNKHALLTGISLQFLVLPLVGFIIVKIFNFSASVGITLLVVTSSPGGSYSNWWCSLFNAELALSVTMTALSTFLSVVMLPVNLVIYASSSYSNAVVKSLDWRALFMSLFVVIGGISSGLFCSAYFKDSPRLSRKIQRAANRFGNIAGLFLITFSIAVSSSNNNAALWDEDAKFFIGVALPAIIGITIATGMATTFNLDKPERVAVAVESCYQNTGIATSVAVFMFNSNKDDLATAISVPLYYGICEAVMLACYCIICWKIGWTKAPADENFCVMLATSYEVEPDDNEGNEGTVDDILGNISDSENDEEETAEEDINKTQDLVFESTIDSTQVDDESLQDRAEGVAILRRVDTNEHGQPLEIDSALQLQMEEKAESQAESIPEDDVDEPPEQPENNSEISRFGRTLSLVKARVTGYRQAPLPAEDGERSTTSDRMPASMSDTDDALESPSQQMDGSSRVLNRPYERLTRDASNNPDAGQRESEPPIPDGSTLAEGKTID